MHKFRPAIPTDAESIIAFQKAMAWETEKLHLDPALCEPGVRAVFSDASRGQYHVCELNGAVIGSLLITQEWSDWRNGAVWWIQSVFFLPGQRGKGYFSEFYSYIKQLAAQDVSVRGVRLYVDISNSHAQDVYKKLGMNGDHYKVFEWMKEKL